MGPNVSTVSLFFFLFSRNPCFVGDSLLFRLFTSRVGLWHVGTSVTVAVVAVVLCGSEVDVEPPLLVVDDKTLERTLPLALSERLSHKLGVVLVAAARLWQEPWRTMREGAVTLGTVAVRVAVVVAAVVWVSSNGKAAVRWIGSPRPSVDS